MNIAQCKMARAGLGWSLDDLAEASGISRRTVAKFEGGHKVAPETVETLRSTLAKEGVEFINGGKRHGASVLRKEQG